VVDGAEERWNLDRVVRLAPGGAVACSVLFPTAQVTLAFGYPGGTRAALWSLAATAAYLPLHLRHVWHAARGARPPAGLWTLAAMAVVILGVTPFAGSTWPRAYVALVVSTVLVLPGRWSYPLGAVLILVAGPVSHAMGMTLAEISWVWFTLMAGSTALLLLIWLAAALIRLQSAREALAQQAVVQERRRIDDDLRSTLGAALEAIAARGERSCDLLTSGDQTCLAAEMAKLSEDARTTLADARQRVRGYRRPSLRAELETAAALLSAAGITTRLDLPQGPIPATIDERPRAALRATLTRLLRDRTARACVIAVSSSGGRVRLELRTDGSAETIEVAA
jgi:two-component system sensor histidine kinase DesK